MIIIYFYYFIDEIKQGALDYFLELGESEKNITGAVGNRTHLQEGY